MRKCIEYLRGQTARVRDASREGFSTIMEIMIIVAIVGAVAVAVALMMNNKIDGMSDSLDETLTRIEQQIAS